jgi:hypothetical protein
MFEPRTPDRFIQQAFASGGGTIIIKDATIV